jgi:hypothetical protein
MTKANGETNLRLIPRGSHYASHPAGSASQGALAALLSDSIEKVVEGKFSRAAKLRDPLERALVAQSLLPSAAALKEALYIMRSDSALEANEARGVTHAVIARELGVSKALVQIMIREARQRRGHS